MAASMVIGCVDSFAVAAAEDEAGFLYFCCAICLLEAAASDLSSISGGSNNEADDASTFAALPLRLLPYSCSTMLNSSTRGVEFCCYFCVCSRFSVIIE